MGKGAIYKVLYPRWRTAGRARAPGYTVLLPVPGDLPVFLKIALEVCAAQRAEHRVETIVIPDETGPAFERLYQSLRSRWTGGPLRLVKLGPVSNLLSVRLKYPGIKHWLQLVHGINATRSTHVLLHDADLFISDPGFLEQHYLACVRRNLVCLGVSEAWDAWYRQNNLGHVTATWELMFDVDWARTFKPWQHRGHDGVLRGTTHMFDTMLLPQSLTSPEKISRHEKEWGFVHFNYVISTYRAFQRSRGPFEDADFRLLLIRLLVDAWDDSGWDYPIPALAELTRGLADASARVTYRSPQARANYSIFRPKLQKLIDAGGIVDADKAKVLREGVQSFDAAFAQLRSAVAPA